MKSSYLLVFLIFASPVFASTMDIESPGSADYSQGSSVLPALLPLNIYVATTGSDLTGDGSQGNPYLTLQRASLDAANGDTIILFDGVYDGADNQDISFADQLITIQSLSDDPVACIIDLEGADGIHFQLTDQYAVGGLNLSGITFRGGGVAVSVDGFFSGMETANLASYQVMNCHFEDNLSGLRSVWCVADIQGCRFTGNTIHGLDFQMGEFLLSECHFELNGVGLRGVASSPEISFCNESVFVRNDIGIEINTYAKNILPSKDKIGQTISFSSCRVDSNTVDGFKATGACTGGLIFTDTDIRDNVGYGGTLWGNFHELSMTGGSVTGNGSHGLYTAEGMCGPVILTDVLIAGNGGLGIDAQGNYGSLNFIGCTIKDNLLGGIQSSAPSQVVDECLIVNNFGDGLRLGIIDIGEPQSLQITNSTVAGNTGLGLWSDFNLPDLTNSIFAFNTDLAADLPALAEPTVSGCDVFGNNGGNWVGAIAAQFAISGNISADPQFCDLENGDLTLRSDSPCLEGNHPTGADFGLIGTLGLGCFTMGPYIISIEDVGNDQGRQVRLIWNRSEYDALGSPTPILEYGIYRRQDEFAASSPATGSRDKLAGWDFLGAAPARGDEVYQYIAPTLCDSTITSGLCLSTFMVSAMTAQPLVYFDSPEASGYSLDNLAPGEPVDILAAYLATGVTLDWRDAPEDDFQHYRIYRGDEPDFVPSEANLVYQPATSAWVDPITNPWDYHYKITTVDFAGNESPAGAPSDVSAVKDGALPTRPSLQGAVPNPFNPSTRLSFALTSAGHARLMVYDAAGRMVVTLVDAHREAGAHSVTWDGRDRTGRMSAAGVYLYRLEVGGFQDTKSMMLVK